jgi:hypothetical protein
VLCSYHPGSHGRGRVEDEPAIIVPLRGAISRVGLRDSAFALRQPGYEIDITGLWSTPAEKAEAVRWVEATRDSLQPFAHGVYVNQLGNTSDQLVRAAYGSNYARLVEIKKSTTRAMCFGSTKTSSPHRRAIAKRLHARGTEAESSATLTLPD